MIPAVRAVIEEQEKGLRVDAWLAQRYAISRQVAARFVEMDGVYVRGKRAAKGTRLSVGDEVTLGSIPQSPVSTPPSPEPNAFLEVLYEDADVVVVNKPAGQHVHPLTAGETGTVASALVARYPSCAEASPHAREGGFCHRLDYMTSGVLLAARHREAWLALHQAFLQEQMQKEYWALCVGTSESNQGEIELPLLPMPGQPGKMKMAETADERYQPDALPAFTQYEVVCSAGEYHLVHVWPRTGRRHQIRVHLASIGLPLYGDTLYGGPADPNEPGWLHARRLTIPALPSLNRETTLTIEAPLSNARNILLLSLIPQTKDLLQT